MSIVRVWTSKGKWSDAVCGLDKVHLMKRAIRTASIVCDDHGEYLDDPFKDYEIDAKAIYSFGLYSDEDKYRSDINWKGLYYNVGGYNGGAVDFSTVHMFKMPLQDLIYLAGKDKHLSLIYHELIDFAGIPSSSDKHCCLLLKFEEE